MSQLIYHDLYTNLFFNLRFLLLFTHVCVHVCTVYPGDCELPSAEQCSEGVHRSRQRSPASPLPWTSAHLWLCRPLLGTPDKAICETVPYICPITPTWFWFQVQGSLCVLISSCPH